MPLAQRARPSSRRPVSGGPASSGAHASHGAPAREPPQRDDVEGLRDAVRPEAVAADRAGDPVRPRRGRVLELDEVARRPPVAGEHLVERQRPRRRRQLVDGHGVDAGVDPRRPQQRRVVDDHERAAGRGPHVELEPVGALLQRQVVGGERVLRGVGRGAPVGDDLRAGRERSHAPQRTRRAPRPGELVVTLV